MFGSLRGEETTTRRNIVRLGDIPTWTDFYGENKKYFADTLSDTTASTPEEEAAANYSDPSSKNSEENNCNLLEQNKHKELRPLSGLIELTTEPDMITLDDDPNKKRAKMPCGHVIGSDSMTDYCWDNLTKGKFKFICPTLNCKCEWEYSLVRHVACFTDEEMLQVGKTRDYNFVKAMKGNQLCPNCKTWCMRVRGTGNRVRCPICTANRGKKFDFCWICLNEWKKRFRSAGSCGNGNCDGKDTLAKCATKRINLCSDCPSIRECPKCGLLIEHQDKCAHVSCRNCHFGFCFICLQEYNKDEKRQCSFLGTCKLAPRQTS